MTLVDIFLILLIVSASTLCVFIIIYLKKIVVQIELVRSDINEVVRNTLPLLEDLKQVTERTNKIVAEAENYWDEIDRSIKNLRERVTNLKPLSKFRETQSQATDLIKNFKAIVRGIYAFWQEYKSK